MLYHEKKFQDSASYYELSLEHCGEDDSMIWANWGRSLYWTDDGRQDAIDKFKRAIALTWSEWYEAPGDPLVIGNLIEYHAMIGDGENTLRLISMADSLASENPELLYQIGDAYELVGDRSAALRYLGEAIHRGIAVERILDTQELADLVEDPRFIRMVSATSGTEESRADSLQ
jgi:tetratricopeptide (TPR) repeat protein